MKYLQSITCDDAVRKHKLDFENMVCTPRTAYGRLERAMIKVKTRRVVASWGELLQMKDSEDVMLPDEFVILWWFLQPNLYYSFKDTDEGVQERARFKVDVQNRMGEGVGESMVKLVHEMGLKCMDEGGIYPLLKSGKLTFWNDPEDETN